MNKTLALALFLFCATARSFEANDAIVAAMQSELNRSMSRLRLKGYEPPYFIAYTVRDTESVELVGRFGALVSNNKSRNRQAYVEVRTGDYQFDNTSSDRNVVDINDVDNYEPSADAPIDDDADALRGTLWLLTDGKFKKALADYAKKRGQRVNNMPEDENLPSFSREPAAQHLDPKTPFTFDANLWSDRVRKTSALFRDHPDLFDAGVKVNADRVTRYFVNSEGTVIRSERTIFGCHLSAAARAKDGMLLEHEKDFYGHSESELPDEAQLLRTTTQLITELKALRAAPVIDPYTGPALLMEEASGVFFHETVGHRLEGERQNDEKEGRTFKGQVGKRVLPEFLSVVDDPTSFSAADHTLNGWYRFDDEGVATRSVTLIDRGVLKDYLKSRTPIAGSLRSNGHGRSEGASDPIGRMGNLFVRSKKQVPLADLKKMLLDEVRRQGKPFGLIIRDITGGSTNTSNYGYQAFKGQPRLVYRVDAKTGQETLVRGVEMVGTPLTTVSKIVATSDTLGVFNGFCGAESGYIPVSTVAPAVLMSEIELQRTQRAAERPPILPPPWHDQVKTATPQKTQNKSLEKRR
jgi:predicted Zn-dependent protease